MLARAGAAPPRVSHLAPHGLKAMCPTWATKADVRRMLGNHSRPDEKMVVIYARENMCAPLRELGRLLAHI
eukprot:4251431-Amphidinium_carterae.1